MQIQEHRSKDKPRSSRGDSAAAGDPAARLDSRDPRALAAKRPSQRQPTTSARYGSGGRALPGQPPPGAPGMHASGQMQSAFQPPDMRGSAGAGEHRTARGYVRTTQADPRMQAPPGGAPGRAYHGRCSTPPEDALPAHPFACRPFPPHSPSTSHHLLLLPPSPSLTR